MNAEWVLVLLFEQDQHRKSDKVVHVQMNVHAHFRYPKFDGWPI